MKNYKFSAVLGIALGLCLAPGVASIARAADAPMAECPVTHEKFVDSPAHKAVMVDGHRVAFCCGDCPAVFAANPEKYVTPAMLGKCAIQGGPNHTSSTVRVILNNDINYFCCAGCDTQFSATPAKYVKSLTDVVTTKPFTPNAASPRSDYKGQVYLFADAANKATFDASPTKYAVLFGPKK